MLKQWCSAVAVALGLAIAGPALGQAFPTKPVRIVVPFAAGSATDIMARLLGDTLSKQWGQQVLIENRGGPVFAEAPLCADLSSSSHCARM